MHRSVLLIFLAFLFLGLRVEHSVLFYDLGRDKRYQMNFAGNFAAGKGLSHCVTTPEDISKVNCGEFRWWSVGYPVVVGSLYKLTGDLITADYLLILLGLLLFLLASYRFFSLWSAEREWTFAAFLIFAGFSFTPFNYLGTNDLLSTSLVILMISEASLGLLKRKRSGFVVSGICALGAASFKFSFYPFLAVVPCGLVLISLIRRDSTAIRFLLYFLAPLAAGFLAILATFPDHALPPQGVWIRNWNWNNLLAQDPFGARGLFFIDFLLRRLDASSPAGAAVLAVIHAFSIGIVAAGLFAASSFVRKNFRSGESDGRVLSALLGILTVLLVISYLMWLSVRMPTLHHPVYGLWTFVQETRYYGPVMVLLIYAVFLVPKYLGENTKSWLRTASLALVAIVCSYSVAYWSWKNFDYFYNGRIDGSYAMGHKDDADVAEFLKNDKLLDRHSTVLGFVSHASSYGYPMLLTPTDPSLSVFPWYDWYVGAGPVKTSQPRTLLVTINKSPSEQEREFLDRYTNTQLLQLLTYDLYRVEIIP